LFGGDREKYYQAVEDLYFFSYWFGAVGVQAQADGYEAPWSKSLDGQEKPLTEGAGEAKEGTGKPNPNNVKVSQGHQDKHIPGTNNYKQSVANGQNRSILNKNPQQLLDGHAGTGTSMGANKEWVDFGKVIGQYYDTSTGTYVDTTKGIIHYNSKGGAHIVPSNPKGMR